MICVLLDVASQWLSHHIGNQVTMPEVPNMQQGMCVQAILPDSLRNWQIGKEFRWLRSRFVWQTSIQCTERSVPVVDSGNVVVVSIECRKLGHLVRWREEQVAESKLKGIENAVRIAERLLVRRMAVVE
jgi:hypothetical protein